MSFSDEEDDLYWTDKYRTLVGQDEPANRKGTMEESPERKKVMEKSLKRKDVMEKSLKRQKVMEESPERQESEEWSPKRKERTGGSQDKKEPTERRRGRKEKAKREDSYEKYEYDDVVKFISLIEESEFLWNPLKTDFHRRSVKSEKFAEIEEKCRCAEERWQEISTDYAQHQKRIQKALSGSGTSDVRSDFRYAEHLSFLCIAAAAREPKNAFCVGAGDDDEESMLMATPKRAREVISGPRTPKVPKLSRKPDSFEEVMREEMDKTRQTMLKMFESPTTGASMCSNDRVCEVYANVASGKSRWEMLEMEGKVIAYISSFRNRGGSEPPLSVDQRDQENTYFALGEPSYRPF
ncbi:hypothetical protein GCK72_006402 [Caenorhabditis remanei]|uniref:MADF domain-containing protein n=1 Tax=Caenorhabditis remanei TaxID=31234 RepID=A0A6A5HG81_CAERE|nr:hypothetical protein GCK72_005546 [Caenorhabditis remanei]XP_053589806.1 hypothetical protein GCK72_006402 [Caenorhabditis remanei]KAF1765594.1 hypothetical protein GCK72_005546 [Caenorhabditis remanei]KAF1766445.1 hypothetical protein GCK72_006402 [Caenorhabditis remanei]